MADSYGPRVYLVGRILSALLSRVDYAPEEAIEDAIRYADQTLDRLQWPSGKPGS